MCVGMGEMILFLYILVPTIIIAPIISTIAFIYMARFKGKMILVSALFLPIFGIIPAAVMGATLSGFFIDVLELFNIETTIIVNVLLLLFSILGCTLALYSVLGYACRKWRIKNNIPSNRVLEKDFLVIMIALLVCNIIYIIYIYLTYS